MADQFLILISSPVQGIVPMYVGNRDNVITLRW